MVHPKRLYFRGLDGLRAYAAFSVLVVHLPNSNGLEIFFLGASYAVNLFFVISGFLITTLLLEERAESGTVQVRKFYARRALRIFPLYYLILLLRLVLPYLLPSQAWLPLQSDMILGFAFLMGNIVSASYGWISIVGVFWTIAIEEWFYSVWGLVVKGRVLVIICLIIILLRLIFDPIITQSSNHLLIGVWGTLQFEAMAVGALGAWLYKFRPGVIGVLRRRAVFRFTMVCVIGMVLLEMPISVRNTIFTSIIFLALIVNVIRRPGILEHEVLRWMGKRAYGIYMWHPVVLAFVNYLGLSGLAIIPITIAGTFVIAAVSYRWFETPFLRLKDGGLQPVQAAMNVPASS